MDASHFGICVCTVGGANAPPVRGLLSWIFFFFLFFFLLFFFFFFFFFLLMFQSTDTADVVIKWVNIAGIIIATFEMFAALSSIVLCLLTFCQFHALAMCKHYPMREVGICVFAPPCITHVCFFFNIINHSSFIIIIFSHSFIHFIKLRY